MAHDITSHKARQHFKLNFGRDPLWKFVVSAYMDEAERPRGLH
jgi:hypothetical protein